jgi:hypothetical protein
MDLLDLIAEESQAVRMLQGIGENVDDSAADGILPRCRYEIDPLESLTDQDSAELIVRNLVAHIDRHERSRNLLLVRNRFFQGARIGNYIQRTFSRIHYLADGSRTLDAERGFVIAPLYGAAAVRKEEYTVAFYQIIEVRTAILGGFPVRKDDEMGSFFDCLGYYKPACRQNSPLQNVSFEEFILRRSKAVDV